MKKQWIYQIRGIAIIAAVVEHQMGVLHTSETIQLLTLFCVTTLIYLMGVTKSFSIEKAAVSGELSNGMLRYSIRSMLPVICSYVVATFLYLCTTSGTAWAAGGTVPFSTVFLNALEFGASPAFYFISLYILLSLWAPFLYTVIKKALSFRESGYIAKTLILLSVLMVVWLIGYWSIGRVDIFGESYLFVYSCGLLTGQMKSFNTKKIYFIPAFILLAAGFVSTKRFYWARIAGNYNYSDGIDFLAPKLQLNPPNISILLYSFGVIFVAYLLFESCNNSRTCFFRWIGKPFGILGKYSMDIFLYHLMIEHWLSVYIPLTGTPVLKWVVYQCSMFIIPILVRWVYSRAKSKAYEMIRA